ncbi:MAG: PilN domain-containing protein [Pontibacterium sp.]
MSTLINLRPWREERNALRQKQFVTNSALSAVAAVVIVFVVGYFYEMQIERQNERNQFLKVEIAKLDVQRREIEALEDKRARLLERLQAIHELQGNRPVIVRNFDELVQILPDGIHYGSLERRGETVTITGFALDNLDVSALMRELDASVWFGEPNLSQVDKQAGARNFNLSVDLTMPSSDEEETP